MELLNSSIVVKGEGFTPKVVSAKVFREVFPEPPSRALASPPVAVLEYPSRHRVLIQEDRIEVSRAQPPAPEDELMHRAIAEINKLWPLVEPTAVGVNFIAAQFYEGNTTPGSIRGKLLRVQEIETLFESPLTTALLSLTFLLSPARVTVKIVTDRQIDGRAAFVLDLNAHYEPVTDLNQVVQTQQQWYERLLAWQRRLENGSE